MNFCICTKSTITSSTGHTFLCIAPTYVCSTFFIFLFKQYRLKNPVWHFNNRYLKFLLNYPSILYTRLHKIISTYTVVPRSVSKFVLCVSFWKVLFFPYMASNGETIEWLHKTHTPFEFWRKFVYMKHLTSIQHTMYTLHVPILKLFAKHLTGQRSCATQQQRVVFTVDRARFIIPTRNGTKVYYITATITDSLQPTVCVYPQVGRIARAQKLRPINSIHFIFARRCSFMKHVIRLNIRKKNVQQLKVVVPEKKKNIQQLKLVVPEKKKKVLVPNKHAVLKNTNRKDVVVIRKRNVLLPAIKKSSTAIASAKGNVVAPKRGTYTIEKKKARPLKVVVPEKKKKSLATTKHAVFKNSDRKDAVVIKKKNTLLPIIKQSRTRIANSKTKVAVLKNSKKKKGKLTTEVKAIVPYISLHKPVPNASLIHSNMKYAFPYNNKLFLTYGYKHKHHNIGRAKVWEFISIRFGIGKNLAELLLSRVGASNNCMLATFFRYKCTHSIRELQGFFNIRRFDRIGLELICVYLKRLLASKSRKARRFAMQYPVHGQRTHTNASTARKLNLYFELSNRPTEYYYPRIFLYPPKQHYKVVTNKRKQKSVRQR